jgi:hypothetical protein
LLIGCLGRLVVARVQVLAGPPGNLKLGLDDPKLLQGDLGLIELSAAFGVGPVLYAMGAHAASERDR